MREIVFDTETTGLSPRDGDRIIEIGALELINHFPTGKTFHVFINPGDRKVDPGALDVHGISNEFLQNKPLFEDIVADFLNFFDEGMLIAHNAGFDMGFVNTELKRLGRPAITNERVIDSLQIARRKHPAGPNSLDALCVRYNIDNSRRTRHGALLDSELLAEVYLELIGGRQAGLDLADDDNTSSIGISATTISSAPQKQRPVPLTSRLTADERLAHDAFVETMGENALWKRV